jgi:hypothetical protein
MTDLIVKSKWKLTSIEYTGLGDKPYFILSNSEGEIKVVPVEKGITNLRHLLDLEEE